MTAVALEGLSWTFPSNIILYDKLFFNVLYPFNKKNVNKWWTKKMYAVNEAWKSKNKRKHDK